MPLTQHELVSRLGISRGTLHRILTDSPLVKSSTRERVLKELENLDYTPNAVARGLKTRCTRTIGIIGVTALKLSNMAKINALHVEAKRRGYSLIIGHSNGSPQEDETCVRELRSRMVDGFVALGRGLPENISLYRRIIRGGIPLVTIYPLPELKVDCVHVDTRQAYHDLTSYLISLGHRKIGLLLDCSSSQYTLNREAGFRQAMAEAGLPVVEDWVVRVSPDGVNTPGNKVCENDLWDISDYEFGFVGGSMLLAQKNRPTALVCLSDEYAVGVLRAADLAGVRVPENLAVVGYDGSEVAKFARVPLTTMHQPDAELGAEVIRLLLDRIEKRRTSGTPITSSLPTRLVIRQSCGNPAGSGE